MTALDELYGEVFYGFKIAVGPQAGYALRRPSWELYGGDPHHACHMTAFCRNPLHPGPCKGWKKHLGILAPGALHALERIRHDKLEEQRKIKVKGLMDAGKPVPKKLLVPVKYDPVKNKHLNVDLADPAQAKQVADSKTPITAPTKKDVEVKLAGKHAAEADAKVQAAAKMVGNHSASVSTKLSVFENLDKAGFDSLSAYHQGEVKKWLTSVYPYNPKLRPRIAAKLADFTGEQKWKNAAAQPAYTDAMEKVAKYAQVGPKASTTLSASFHEKLGTYDSLTAEEWKGLHPSERKFVLAELDSGSKFGKATGAQAEAIKKKLQGFDGSQPDAPKSAPKPPMVKQTIKQSGVKHGDVAVVDGKVVKVEKNAAANTGYDFLDENGKRKWAGGGATKHLIRKATPEEAADFNAKHGAAKDAIAAKIVADQAKAGPPKITVMHEPPGKSGADAFYDQPFGPHPDVKKAAADGAMAAAKTSKMAGGSVTPTKMKELEADLTDLHLGGKKGGKDLNGVADKTAEIVLPALVSKTKFNTGMQLSPDEQDKLKAELTAAFKGENGGKTPILDAIHAAWKDPNKNADMLQALGIDNPFADTKVQVGHEVDAPEAEHKADMYAEINLDHAKAVASGKYDAQPTHIAGLSALITKEQFDQDLSEHAQGDLLKKMHSAHAVGNEEIQDKINATLTKLGQKPIAKPTPPPVAAGSDASLSGGPSPVSSSLMSGKSNLTIMYQIQSHPGAWDNLSPGEKNIVAGKLHSEAQMGAPEVQAIAKEIIAKHKIKEPDPFGNAGYDAPSAPASGPATSYIPMPVHPPHVFLATDYAAGIKSGTAKQKVAAYDKLSQEDFAKLTETQKLAILGDLKKIEAKFLAPAKKAEAKAIHDKLLTVAVTPPPAAPAKSVADSLATHVGELGLPPFLKQLGTNTSIGTWLGNTSFDNALVDTGIDIPSMSAIDGTFEFGDAAKKALVADFKEALDTGQPTPGGLAGKMPGIIEQVSQGATKIQGDMGWSADSPALGAWKAATFKALVEKEMVGLPSGAGGAATPLPTTVADAVAPPKIIGALSTKQNDILKGAYKSLTGSYLKEDTAETNFDNLMAVAQVYSGHPDVGGKLSFGQVMNAVDQSLADQLGVANSGMLASKIRDWLGTPGGKAYADSHTPNASKISQLTGAVQSAIELAEFKKNHKHPVYPGPGAFDPSKSPSDFKPLKLAESKKLQEQLSAKLGKPFLSKSNTSDPAYKAMNNYTGSGASYMNAYLRNESGSASANIHTAMEAKILEDAMTPADHDQLLWRRTGWDFVPPQYRSEAGMKSLIGDTFSDKGFASTTVAGQPGSYGSGLPVRLEIEAPAGTRGYHAQHLSKHLSENEYILGSGQVFQVLAVKKGGGDHSGQLVIRVRVVTP